MDTLLRDARQALRFLARRPLFSVVAILSLAMGIGVNTSIFSAVNALLLRPPSGVVEPERVVELGRTRDGQGFDTFSYPDLLDLRAAPGFAGLSAWRMTPLSVSLGEEARRTNGMVVSANYFSVLGVRPAIGRFFLPEEERVPGGHPVAVVSDRFWRETLEADAEAIGSTILVNRHPFTVIGVAPPEFRGHFAAVQPEVWVPISMTFAAGVGSEHLLTSRASVWMMIVGRLAPGASHEEANAAVAATMARLREAYPESNRDRGARVAPLSAVAGAFRGPVTAFLGVLLALSGVVLLVTCANVAGLLLARSATREREIAIRLALGAGRGRLIRQLVTEAMVLFVIGGAGGLLLAVWVMGLVSAIDLPTPVPIELDLAADGRVIAFGLALALMAGLLSSLLPALQSSRPDLVPALKDDRSDRSGSKFRLRRLFVSGQVGLSLLLLCAAGLFLRSLQRSGEIPTGFDPEEVEMVTFDLSLDGYDEESGRRFLSSLLDRTRGIPGVSEASIASDLPMDMSANEQPFLPDGWKGPEHGMGSAFNIVGDGYFETLRVRVLEGRGFTPADDARAPGVAVVSRTFASRAWPGEPAVGRRIQRSPRPGEAADPRAWLTVVGVVDDVKNQLLTEEPEPMAYLPVAQSYEPELSLLVRSDGPSRASEIRQAIHALDPNLSRTPVRSVESYTGLGLLPQRLAASLSTGLGVLALLLSALGVYGVVAYSVAQRSREIGIRLAVGADRRDILRLVLGGTVRMVLPGVLAGGALALALSQLIRSFLIGISPADPVTFAGTTALLLAVVALASLSPARRASRTDPMEALRTE